MVKKNILITGLPGTGKTTLIKKIHDHLHVKRTGFYTEEIREKGERKGFALISLEGMKSVLAHVDFPGRARVGKYGVNVEQFDTFLESINILNPNSRLIIIDEIGKMECFSSTFKGLLQRILDSSVPLVATVSLRGEGIIAEVKKRGDVRLLSISAKNRDTLLWEVLSHLENLIHQGHYSGES